MSEETYYKAVRSDGTDFYSGQVLWDRVGEIVEHPNPGGENAKGYLSVSVSPTDCTGMKWPCRLFEVEPVEGAPVWEPTPDLPSKRASHAWRVVRELPAYEALGPNGAEVAAFLDLLPTLTRAQWDAAWSATLDATRSAARVAAWVAARDAAWNAAGNAASNAVGDAASNAARDAAWNAASNAVGDAARDAARDAAWNAAGNAAWDAAWGATGALLVRDLITTEQFDVLTAPMRAAGINFDSLTGATDTRDQEDEQEMPTIDHQQAAVRAMNRHRWATEEGKHYATMPLAQFEPLDSDRALLTAATPHLRAAWEQPIRGLCEAAIKRANDPLAARGFYGEAFPATVYAQDILDLLEGGGEDK